MSQSQKELDQLHEIQEGLITARMAVQTKQEKLAINGSEVNISRGKGSISIYEREQLLFKLTKN